MVENGANIHIDNDFILFDCIKRKYDNIVRYLINLDVEWYKKYNLSAVMADVLIIVIGIIMARFVYPYVFGEKFSLINFIGLAVAIQITHDISFYYMFKMVPRGANRMLDTFKDYANEVGFKAVLSDSLMMITACILSSYFVSLNLNTNIADSGFAGFYVPETSQTAGNSDYYREIILTLYFAKIAQMFRHGSRA